MPRGSVVGHKVRRASVAAGVILVAVASACAGDPSPSAVPGSEGAAPTSPDASFPSATSPDVPSPFPPTSDAASPVAVGEYDACQLLLPDELAAAVGVGSATAMPAGGWAAGQCAWSGADASFFLSIGTPDSILAFDEANEPDAAAKLIAYQEENAGQPVDSIGDAAVSSAAGLAFRKGDIYVEITRLRLADDQLLDVARVVSENLQQ